ncbi:Ankyrin repeat protein 2 [Giardia muris]|uniref:Ankyrin repeat protein 2 n=1 Tax=Giardia muris TaxID=5742 RepID=A0A4Z1SVQ4_GIAMU|nr:Ankyrin repeat protein 2 [Giardia muris]|eukprot:TNJ29854.1 Ankyrin repeat protein 2 [Giardia muris]
MGTPLIQAVKAQNLEMVKDNHQFLRKKGANGMTALMHAVQYKNDKIVGLLLSEVKLQDDKGRTALYYALECDAFEITQFLISEAGYRDKKRLTPFEHFLSTKPDGLRFVMERWLQYSYDHLFSEACHENHEYVEKLLTSLYGLPRNGTNLIRAVILHCRENRHSSLIEKYLWQARLQDSKGMTALMYAASYGNAELVKSLSKEEMGLRDRDGNPALYYAITQSNRECASLLLSEASICNNDCYTVLDSCIQGHTDIVIQLIELLANLADTQTAFDFAVQHGHKVCAIFLLTGKLTWNGGTLLMASALANRPDIARSYLHKAGCRDKQGRTALMHAVESDHCELVSLLLHLESGMKDDTKSTALIMAAKKGNVDFVNLLRETEKGYTDKFGWTALMYAIANGQMECAELLIGEAGTQSIEENGRWKKGASALMIASNKGLLELVSALRAYEKGLLDEEGYSALLYAIGAGHDGCARLLLDEIVVTSPSGITQLAYLHALLKKEESDMTNDTHALMVSPMSENMIESTTNDCSSDRYETRYRSIYTSISNELEETFQRYTLRCLQVMTPRLLKVRLQCLFDIPPGILDIILTILFDGVDFLEVLDDALLFGAQGDSCIVCYCQYSDTVTSPCRHMLMCYACAEQVYKSENPLCPYCRIVIDNLIVLEPVQNIGGISQ